MLHIEVVAWQGAVSMLVRPTGDGCFYLFIIIIIIDRSAYGCAFSADCTKSKVN